MTPKRLRRSWRNCFKLSLTLPPTTPKRMTTLSHTRRAHDRPGLIINPPIVMAWRPYENLIDGELDNHLPGKVTGWMRFYRGEKRPLKVKFDLEGDFHEDIRGKVIRLTNPEPSDRSQSLGREGTYLKGFSAEQRGEVGDITAGLPLGPWTEELARTLITHNEAFWNQSSIPEAERAQRWQKLTDAYHAHIAAGDLFYPYVPYPYIEWYSEANGRVVLELEYSQVEIVDVEAHRAKSPEQLFADERRRSEAMSRFLSSMASEFSRESRSKGGDGNVFGAVIN